MHSCVATLESLFGSVNYSHEVVGVRTAAEGDSKKTLGPLPTNFARQKFEVARGRRRRMKEVEREDDTRNISIRPRWESPVSFPVCFLASQVQTLLPS